MISDEFGPLRHLDVSLNIRRVERVNKQTSVISRRMERRIFRFLRWNRRRENDEEADEDSDADSDEAGKCI